MHDSNQQTTASRPGKSQARAQVCQLGRQPYAPVWQAMQSYTDQRDGSSADQIWVLEHERVFTQGQAGKAEHVLAAGEIPVLQVDRGGQVTYHGPGQLVVYPLLDLRRLGLGVRELVHRLEQAVIDTLQHFAVTAVRREGAPGVYVEDCKIAQLGLRVRRGCTFHGLAFNINMDLEPFARINPCGFAGLQVTELAAFEPGIGLPQVSAVLLPRMGQLLGLELSAATAPELATENPPTGLASAR